MFLYVIGPQCGAQKIGFSENPTQRLRTLQTASAEPLLVHTAVLVPKHRVRLLEKQLHRELGYRRLTGEWFDLSPDDAVAQVHHAVIRWADDPLLGI